MALHLGKNIKQLAEIKGVSIKTLAEKVGVREQQIYRIFKQDHLNTETLEKIAEVLNVPVTSIFDLGVSNSSLQKSEDVNQDNKIKRKVIANWLVITNEDGKISILDEQGNVIEAKDRINKGKHSFLSEFYLLSSPYVQELIKDKEDLRKDKERLLKELEEMKQKIKSLSTSE